MLSAATCLQRAAGLLKVIIAAKRTVGAGLQAQPKVIDGRLRSNHARTVYVGRRLAERGKCLLFVAEYQLMAVWRMPKVVVEALFETQTLNKAQIGLAVLHAIIPWRVRRERIEGVGVAENAVLFEQGLDDLLHG